MPRSMTILAVLHQIQGPKFHGYIEDPSYKFWIKKFLLDGVDFVFEEASGRGPSDAEKAIAISGASYLDIDPTADERKALGIPKATSGGGPIDPAHSYDVYESAQVRPLVMREQEWLKRIQATNFKNGLTICGIAHGLSFAVTLEASGISVKEIFNYIPHSLACPQGPHRMP